MDWFLGLKPSRRFLVALIAAALFVLVAALLGYRPASLASLNGTARAEFMTSVIAVVATFIGVAVAGWVTLEQLDSEREDRHKERSLSAKHAALMDGIRGLKNMIAQIALSADLERPQDAISRAFTDAHSQAAPAWAVADLKTVKLLSQLSNDVSMTFMRLGMARNPIARMAGECKDWGSKVESAREEQHRFNESKAEAIAKDEFQDAYGWMQGLKAIDQKLARYEDNYNQAKHELAQKHIPFMLKCVFESRRLQDQYRVFLARIRIEVETAEDGETTQDFTDAFELNDATAIRNLKKAFHSSFHGDIDKYALRAGCSEQDVAASSVKGPEPFEEA